MAAGGASHRDRPGPAAAQVPAAPPAAVGGPAPPRTRRQADRRRGLRAGTRSRRDRRRAAPDRRQRPLRRLASIRRSAAPPSEARRARRARRRARRATSRATPTRASTAGASSSSTRGSSTLPLGVDRLGATRRFAQRNVARLPAAVLDERSSSPGGVPLGYAQPGQHARARRPLRPRPTARTSRWSPARPGPARRSRSTRCWRATSRAARRGYIIDRSSSEDEGGSTPARRPLRAARRADPRRAGHPLTAPASSDAILNPWDVPDPAARAGGQGRVPDRAAHAADRRPRARRPGARRAGAHRCWPAAIHAVYARCADTGELPREAAAARGAAAARARAGRRRSSTATPASPPSCAGSPSACTPTSATARWRGWPIARRRSSRGAPLVLFDLAGLPDALAGAGDPRAWSTSSTATSHRRRARHLAGPRGGGGPWAGRAFVAIDEAWKPLLTPAAGAWLNEWARRTRHIACALLVITQHLADFDNPQGRALLRNSVLRLIFHTSHDELAEVGDALGLHPEDLDAIGALETRKGEYSTCLLDSEVHGRATVRILPLRHRVLGLQRRPRTRPAAPRARARREPTATPGPRCAARRPRLAPRARRELARAATRPHERARAAAHVRSRSPASSPRRPDAAVRSTGGARWWSWSCSRRSACWSRSRSGSSCCSPARAAAMRRHAGAATSPARARSAASPAPASPRAQIERRAHGSPYAGDRVTPGTYLTTAYGPPWGGIQGAGITTSGGLRDQRRRAALVHDRRRPAR